MDLEERSLEPAIPDRCQVCAARLIPSEQQAIVESGSPPLCSIHAVEDVPLEEDQAEADGA
jgi:hypothetical protein